MTDPSNPIVMIVDDDMTMVGLLQTLLEMDGFQAIQASVDSSLVSSILDARPDVVLMDVFMSDTDGLEILQELRSSQSGSDIFVIMTSGMELSDRCKDAGADAFLLKPYQPDELISTIQSRVRKTHSGKKEAT